MKEATTEDVIQQLAGLLIEAPGETLPAVLIATDTADQYAIVQGPLGPLYVTWSREGVSGCVPVAVVGDRAEFEKQARRPVFAVDAPPQPIGSEIERALRSGKLRRLPVDLSGVTDFQRAVLTKTAEIPPGEVRPYGWVAREIGRPRAVRAVGTALARNPVPVLIPCHRVVRSDGQIGHYAYGAAMKRELLVAEGVDVDRLSVRN